MIGPWNDADSDLVIAPNCLGLGNTAKWLANVNSGNMPTKGGLYQSCVLTDMGADNGYLYNGGDAYLNGDAINNRITTNKILTFNPTNDITFEMVFDYTDNGTFQILSGLDDGDTTRCNMLIRDTDKPQMSVAGVAGIGKNILSGVPLTNGVRYHLVYRKDAGVISIHTNGSEVAFYDSQDTWVHTKTWTQKLNLMERGGIAAAIPFLGKFYWFCIYNTALSDARILTNSGLGKNMGIKGDAVGDNMTLSAIGGWPLLNQRNELAYNGAQLR